MSKINVSRFVLVALLVVAPFSAACTSDIATYCEKQCDCASSCTGDEDIDACIATGEAQAEIASIYDCGEEFDEAVACAAEERSCDPDSACAARFARVESCLDRVDFARWSLEHDVP